MNNIKFNKAHLWLVVLIACFYFNPFNYDFIFGYLILFFMLISPHLKLFFTDTKGVILLLFSLIYAAFYSLEPEKGSQYIFLYAFIPFVMYSAGKLLSAASTKKIIPIIFILGFFLAAPSLMSVFNDIYENGFVTLKRDVENVWTGEFEPATNTAGRLLMNMCIPGLLLIKWHMISKKNWISLASILVFVVSIIAILRLGSRTHLVIVAFTLFFGLIYKVAKKGVLRNIVLVVVVFILINIGFAYISLDTNSELLSAYADRMDSSTHGVASAGGRSWKWEKSIEFLFTKPTGWRISDIGLSHNLWFDSARVSGTIGFILLLIYTIRVSFSAFKKMLLQRSSEFLYKIEGLMLIYILAFNLLFFVEPIMEGYFNCFVMFCFIAGAQNDTHHMRIKTTK